MLLILYSVDASLYSVTTTYSDLPAGSHSINVKDNNGCIYSTTASISNSNGPTNIDISTTNSTCGEANGSLTLGIVTGGTAPYTYSVDGSLYSVTTTYSDLPAGSHSINVKDNNGCIYSTTASISNISGPTDISVSVTDATCGQDNGSMTLGTVTGGTSPYTYSVDGGAFTSTTVYSNLSAASHAIIVRDANNCEFSTSASISNTSGPTDISVSVTDAACGQDNGSITFGAVTGGTSPYTYSVDGGAFTSTTVYSNLSAASHAITVRDANNCEFSTSASISNTSGPTDISVSVTDATCGQDNGSITLGTVTGGTSPYTYSVDGGAFTSTTVYSNLSAASHAITVRDANNCEFSTSASISNTSGPTDISVSVTDATCGQDNGSITLGTVTGGTSPYTYSVDGGAFTSTTVYSNLSAASHAIIVRDANNCEFSTSASISNTSGPNDISVSVTDATCGQDNGSITFGAVTGGTSPYTYSVDGGAFTSTTVYSNLSAASHAIIVRDANNCEFSTSAPISNTSGPTDISVSVTDATCGQDNGSITLGTVTGGTSPYTYSVDGGAFTSTTVYSNLSAASHAIIVRDDNNCEFSTSASISNTSGPTDISVSVTDAACGEANGSLTLGGVTGSTSPYTYSVDGGAFTSTTVYSNLSAASHAITVRDANNCEFSTSAPISNTSGPTDISVSVTDATCGQDNGSITLGTVTGGTSPYTYSVDGGAFTSTTVYSNLSAASHAIIVRDDNNCEFSTSASISNTSGPTDISVSVTDAACGEANGSLTLGGVTGGTSPYTYSVDGGAFTSTTVYSNLSAASHAITVRDANNCEFSTSASISNTSGPTDISVSVTDAACGEANGSLTLGGVTGGTAPFTYSVDGSLYSVTTTYSDLPAGSHSINVKDNNGCILLYYCLNQQFKRANEHRYLNNQFNMRRGKRISYSWHRNRRYRTVYLFCRWKPVQRNHNLF